MFQNGRGLLYLTLRRGAARYQGLPVAELVRRYPYGKAAGIVRMGWE